MDGGTNVAGPIQAYGGSIIVSQNLTSTGTAQGILLKSTGNISLESGKRVTTNGGSVTLWGDSDGNGSGYTQLFTNAAITSGGGAITMGGGLDIATGYARGEATRDTDSEPDFTLYTAGVHLRAGSSLSSAGGDITLRGQNLNTSASAMVFGVFGKQTTIDSGTGKISITALATGSGSANAQAYSSYGGFNLRSANTTSQAISIVADASGVTGTATSLGINQSGVIQASGAGGSIYILGKGSSQSGYSLGAGLGGSVVASSGSITLIGDNSSSTSEGLNIGGLTLGADASTAVTTSSTNITLKGNQFGLNNPTNFNTSGTVSVLSLDGSNSFGSAQTFSSNWSFGSNISGLTIGSSSRSWLLLI
jgi:hypothetical protein